ncbi:glycoside hydrolase family 79 protein [Acrodontium crateriforme]|uniref:Glycoside hydrolase family 79 protein n=1 Tax=Acrodontium crateriforme TaxID=150365 RepID=A0AAQ3M5G7_9PEZI|nr:glycoside hydrolase family 79 protein [Acrodontium crateriforme]
MNSFLARKAFLAWLITTVTAKTIQIPNTTPQNAGIPLDSFMSYSIELSSFPDFAGNLSHPNAFSYNLLRNIASLSSTPPIIRVGGNTQDYAIFNHSLEIGLFGVYNSSKSNDYPTTISIGPAFFESYHTWPGMKFTHGFNLGRDSPAARKALLESVPYACKSLSGSSLVAWELGNEPNDYAGVVRPESYDEVEYVNEWLYWSRAIRAQVDKACPESASDSNFKFYAPSYGLPDAGLDVVKTFEDDVDSDKVISHIAIHNYIDGADSPGVTLQGTLMNHLSNRASINVHIDAKRKLAALAHTQNPNLPYILSEHNSLYSEGRPGLSNTFGAALWGLDFNLLAAANNISRVHMHQGTDYRYQSWQPIATAKATKGTKAPYYGNIAVAAFIGNLSNYQKPRIVELPLSDGESSAYAAYEGGRLVRIMVINLMEYNATDYNSQYINHYQRPVETYSFQLPAGCSGEAKIQRLMANGSDAITGCTWDGFSYNFELDNGLPVRLGNVTRGERMKVDDGGKLSIGVPRSSAVIISLDDE